MDELDYYLLENIKDGKAISGKFNTKKMHFTTPNVIIVFSNKYPDTREFSEDRWMIFKINTMMELKEVTHSCRVKKKKMNKKIAIESDESENEGFRYDDLV